MLRSAPPVTLCLPVLPLREHEQTLFPTHLLYCYIRRSYQRTHPHGCEQACIDEPLLAQSCRRILLWAYHYAYSKEAMPPKILTICKHTPRLNLGHRLYIRNVFAYGIRVRESNPFSTYDDLSTRTPFATGWTLYHIETHYHGVILLYRKQYYHVYPLCM